MENFQRGILAPVPAHARYLTYELLDASVARAHVAERVQALSEIADGERIVVGMGMPREWITCSANPREQLIHRSRFR